MTNPAGRLTVCGFWRIVKPTASCFVNVTLTSSCAAASHILINRNV